MDYVLWKVVKNAVTQRFKVCCINVKSGKIEVLKG